ncbi:aminotransferase class IV [Actinospica robiniae]|uniref:aminotransferase class IV n=1 Tax=Actinospica robiniae TaxID=304901 RepID=UPI0006868B42|nr:aminotransferase class IV [Actinospica robiniae]
MEIDGESPSADALAEIALESFGHFTAMQVRGGRVRGLGLHLDRLDAANRELFGRPFDGGYVRTLIRQALRGGNGREPQPDASVRVIVRGIAATGAVRTIVTVRPPAQVPDRPQRLRSVSYQREIAHIKRPGDFAHAYHLNEVARAGYDDALLTSPTGRISEGGITNIAFFDGTDVLWPDGPSLAGITMQLVAPRLAEQGLKSRTGRVTLAELGRFAGICVTNSRGVGAVRSVDELEIPVSDTLMRAVGDAYESVPWDEI